MTGLATGIAARVAVPAVIKAVPWRLMFGGAIAIAFLALLAWAIRVNDLRNRWHHQYTSEHSARLADRASYTNAQKAAELQNKAQIERIQSQQQRITTDAEQSYQADLARLRAELARRLHGGTPPEGAPHEPGASPLPGAPGKPDDPSAVRVSADDYVRAAETENQLEHLIQWVEQQMKVDPNKP